MITERSLKSDWSDDIELKEQTVIQSLLLNACCTHYKALPLSKLTQCKLNVNARLGTRGWMVKIGSKPTCQFYKETARHLKDNCKGVF